MTSPAVLPSKTATVRRWSRTAVLGVLALAAKAPCTGGQRPSLCRWAAAASLLTWTAVHATPPPFFFDDFSYPDTAALFQQGWTPRSAAGHPGIAGSRWAPEGVSVDHGKLRLRGATDGTGAGTTQVQVCHQRKYLAGTYAARIRFSDVPVSGADGDPVIQTFYTVSPLKHDFDPEFSELDWEYLPNGGWGSDKTRLYGITWQTVRLEPWLAFNQQHEEFGELGAPGKEWHTLVMQVAQGRTHWFIDGRKIDEHGGRNYPVVPMSINFNLWFSPNGPLPQGEAGGPPRVYEQEVDWVFHAKDAVLSPAEIEAQVARWRAGGVARLDQVPAAEPTLDSRCDF